MAPCGLRCYPGTSGGEAKRNEAGAACSAPTAHAHPHSPAPRSRSAGKSGEEAKRNEVEAAALQRIMTALEQNKPARSVELNDEEAELGGCFTA